MKNFLKELRRMANSTAGVTLALMCLFLTGSMVANSYGFASKIETAKSASSPVLGQTVGTTPFYYPGSTNTPGGIQNAFNGMGYQAMTLITDVSAAPSVTTTPSITITVQHSNDAIIWATHTALTAITGITTVSTPLTNIGRYWRIKAVMANCNYAGQGWAFTITACMKEFTDNGWRDKQIQLAMHWNPESGDFECSPQEIRPPKYLDIRPRRPGDPKQDREPVALHG